MSVEIIGAIATIIAAGVTGWFLVLARRATAGGPESVAGGYSKLVADMRQHQSEMDARIEVLEAERAELKRDSILRDARIEHLTNQVRWLLTHVSNEKREDFLDIFDYHGIRDQTGENLD